MTRWNTAQFMCIENSNSDKLMFKKVVIRLSRKNKAVSGDRDADTSS